jgi:hypothetical protein
MARILVEKFPALWKYVLADLFRLGGYRVKYELDLWWQELRMAVANLITVLELTVALFP